MRPIIIFFCVLILSGCATAGKKVDRAKLDKIKEGVTTEQEVIGLLGNPSMKTLDSGGKTIMLYNYAKIKNKAVNFVPIVNLFAGGLDMKQQMLTVLIGTDGKVEKYTFNDSDSDINSGLINTR